MSSLVDERSWLDIVRSKLPDLDEQADDRPAHPVACADASVFCCPHCNAPVGATDGKQLTAGAIIITSPTELSCMACQQSYEWRPAE
jgi:hypothetical protein